MKRGWIIISVVVLFGVAGITYWLKPELFSRSEKVVEYKKVAVDRSDITSQVTTTGTLNPVTIVEIGSQVSGKIESLLVDFNSKVTAGMLLARLDQSQFITRLKQSQANYRSAVAGLEKAKVTLGSIKKNYDRDMTLSERGLLSTEQAEASETQYYSALADFQAAEARVEVAKSTLESSEVDLTYTTVYSPIDGVVISRNVNVGQTVAASFQAPVLFRIANDLSQMQVQCSVVEADIGRIKDNLDVWFTVTAYPDDHFTGKVKQVRYSPETSQNVVTYSTIVEVNNPEMKLRPGMTATVFIITGVAKNALRVPKSALRFTPAISQAEMKLARESAIQEAMKARGEDQAQRPRTERRDRSDRSTEGSFTAPRAQRQQQPPSVWVQDETRKLKMVLVRTGISDDNYTEILSGLNEGQLVITGDGAERGTSATDTRQPSGSFGIFGGRPR